MSGNMVIREMFYNIRQQLDAKQDIREGIRMICKELEKISGEVNMVLQEIHYNEELSAPTCLKARELFEKAREGYQKLKPLIKNSDSYRFQDHWRSITQQLCFGITLTVWLEAGFLASHDTCADILGIDSKEGKELFHLDIEDYLIGVLMLCTELTRLAANTAAREDEARISQIRDFVAKINMGFIGLEVLENENLQGRIKALQSQLEQIEEILHDHHLHGI